VTEEHNPAHTLLRAANALGSSEQLAHVLHVPIDQLRTWMRGEEAPPQDILERALQIIRSQKPIPR
jgi:DNA-binding transcriptional regulator YiaG